MIELKSKVKNPGVFFLPKIRIFPYVTKSKIFIRVLQVSANDVLSTSMYILPSIVLLELFHLVSLLFALKTFLPIAPK